MHGGRGNGAKEGCLSFNPKENIKCQCDKTITPFTNIKADVCIIFISRRKVDKNLTFGAASTRNYFLSKISFVAAIFLLLLFDILY